ncbi:uncharacterized protein RCC_00900 [Ramularia collo-cygni]|uniref:Uncharacterized protein n=1 Tax=Ramularia collo-cygni TaxID=112498 RepID=A0A2D3UM90_9PEZI|nr:uncharacterized protein RCC_00900 [Ramularia collo-cygni]CZT14981.1 uncharacterized protein RCC_00900 [Ramularia collo-cygni]
MKPFELPAGLLVALFAYSNLIEALSTPTPTITQIASTGSGPEYASACQSAYSSFNSASSAYLKAHEYVSTTILALGGTSYSYVDYIANASTLCDGHPRVTASNYSTLSSGTLTYVNPVTGYSTIVGTINSAFMQPAPTCSISPSDCDPLWATYLSSLSARPPQITAPPLQTPPCMNQTQASSYASATEDVYGCGQCTIYGEGVQLVFWPVPTTVSRDMCASEPTASRTHYGPGAVISAYAGKSVGNNTGTDASLRGYATADGKETIVADGHVFTSGTAYISISSVYAVDRCSKTFGTGVTDAILAMPSESVLSLRYSQDHFQQVMTTDQITGYPVNYADFHTPIPWSAWNGQVICLNEQDNRWCNVIKENYFRPQLAIPPQITDLSPEFKGCQMWYNGLWDPPLALTERSEVAKPTLPASFTQTKEPASPSSTVVAPTATATTTATALSNELPPPTYSSHPAEQTQSSAASHDEDQNSSSNGGQATSDGDQTASSGDQATEPNVAAPTLPTAKAPVPSNEPWTASVEIGGQTYMATGSGNHAVVGSVTYSSGAAAQTLPNGIVASYGSDGIVFDHTTMITFDDAQPTNGPTTPDADTVVVTVSGSSALTVVQSSDGGVIVAGTYTLTPGAGAVTLEDGQVLSAATGGVAVYSKSTLSVKNSHSTSDSGSAQHGSSTGGTGVSPSTTEKADATGGGAQSSQNPGSGASPFSAPAVTSFIMVIFVTAVLAV